ncbi:glycoside-pentoside-hexuronide (GPH):cation symporter [Acholeplasma vituli]|uniref:Glycoside-pentoside-hexuronide (GPH):cation symporter n=1 Tax=Paracholeplasma vituli TaxID=69473 RepID=A0ABT2PVG7_9MOLU|nr:glycoside-pentoside-hexuronide (GPH):cation symporter [Paracholeplasma vituli]MCU0104946.1 glycoside-pentoside-hexuronide (GPH):cation symporter [Paracholeplasma vituli]
MTETLSNRSKWTYAASGLGRDMMYALYSTYLLVFFTDAIGVSDWELLAIGVVIAVARIWDAINDTLMGIIIDNTKSRYGKFKPWLLIGAITSAIMFFLLFQDFGLTGGRLVLVFTIIYVLSDMTFTMNDIAYWSMYPTFTSDPKERESIGSKARIFANLGMFITIALVPIIYQNFAAGPKAAFFWIALVIASIYLISQILVFFVVEPPKNHLVIENQPKTAFKDVLKIIFKNDQLVVIIIAIFLFNTGYYVTTALGIYFFNYDFNKYGGAEFTIFSGILALSQLASLSLFPVVAKKISRKQIFTYAIVFIAIGYLLFLMVGNLLPLNMVFVGLAGFFVFFGEGFIQVSVLVMLADTIEYGQWKLKTRNESVMFAINPFVVKLATSVQVLIVTATLAWSGLNQKVIEPLTSARELAASVGQVFTTDQARSLIQANVTDEMLLWLRISMVVLPALFILGAFLVYRTHYKIDYQLFDQIKKDIEKDLQKGDTQ